MVAAGLRLGEGAALAFPGHHVDQDGPVQLGDVLEVPDEIVETVTFQGAHVLEPQLLEKHPRDDEGLQGLLDLPGELDHLLSPGEGFQNVKDSRFEPGHLFSRHDPVQVRRHGPHVGGNGHLVVVEDDDQVLLPVSRPVHGLVGHPRRHGPVADDGDDLVLFPFETAGLGDAGGGGQGGAAVPGVEDVVRAFLALGEPADAVFAPQGVEPVAAARDELVGIGLVPHVPDEPVPGRVEDIVKGQGEFHRPQDGARCPPFAATVSMIRRRISTASRFSSSTVSRRKSSGESIRSMISCFVCSSIFKKMGFLSAFPLDDKISQFPEGVRFLAEGREAADGLFDEKPGLFPGGLQPVKGGIGQFAPGGVASRSFPQDGRRAFHVQDVVGDLKGKANPSAVFGKVFQDVFPGPGDEGARPERHGDEPFRLSGVNEGQGLFIGRLSFCGDVRHLSGDHAEKTGGLGDFADDRDDCFRGCPA